MSQTEGSSDEAIGRPQEWREGRYQQPGKPVDKTVADPPDAKDRPTDTVSTPVTRSDYD
jgi:hypothetical protein